MDKEVLNLVKNQVLKVYENERSQILNVSSVFAETIKNEGIIHLAALENDKEFLMELYYRAGGLVPFHKVYYLNLFLKNKISYKEYLSIFVHYNHKYTQMLLNMYNIKQNDIFVIVYNGKYDELIEGLIYEIHERNLRIVLISSHELIKKACLIKNSSFANALNKIDYLLDNHVEDKRYYLNNKFYNVRPQIQTIINNVIAQLITVQTYSILKSSEYPTEVFLSENIPNSDEHNYEITKKYEGRWNS